MWGIIVSLLIGAIAGWLAGKIMKSGHGLGINIILGIVGGVVGKFLFGLIGVSFHGFIGSIIGSAIGACVIIAAARAITK